MNQLKQLVLILGQAAGEYGEWLANQAKVKTISDERIPTNKQVGVVYIHWAKQASQGMLSHQMHGVSISQKPLL